MRIGVAVAAVLLVGMAAGAAWVWWSAEQALDRQRFDAIDQRDMPAGTGDDDAIGEVLNVLVVGSDSREGLSEQERQRLHTGSFDGEQTDTVLLFQTTDDGISVVSFPRDLKVQVRGETMKINAVLQGHGRDALIGVVESTFGIDVDHYVEVAIPSFLEVVEAAGGVEICLDEALRDEKSGADFTAGCHEMDGVDALAYVRSRAGERGDYARVERQQAFLRALADRATSLAVLSNPLRLRNLVTEVADGLTVDAGLSVPRMLELADALRSRLDAGLDAATVPSWPVDEEGVAYVIAYPPGVEELATALRVGRPLPPQPTAQQREDLAVGVWSDAAPDEAAIVESVLYFLGFGPEVLGPAPEGIDVTHSTVFHVPGAQQEAQWVAQALGAQVSPLPPTVSAPEGLRVLVATAERSQSAVGGVLLPPA